MVWWGEAVEAWKGENWTGKMRSRSQGTDVIGWVGYGAAGSLHWCGEVW